MKLPACTSHSSNGYDGDCSSSVSTLEPGVEYQGRRARRPYNDRQDRSALQQPQRRTTRAVQRAFGRREISCVPAVDYRHEAQPRRPGRDVARRRVEPAAHRVRSTRLQVRGERTASQRQLDNVDKSRRRLLVLRAVAGPSSCPSSRRSRSLPRSSTAPVSTPSSSSSTDLARATRRSRSSTTSPTCWSACRRLCSFPALLTCTAVFGKLTVLLRCNVNRRFKVAPMGLCDCYVCSPDGMAWYGKCRFIYRYYHESL